jgi:hypothetical protein
MLPMWQAARVAGGVWSHFDPRAGPAVSPVSVSLYTVPPGIAEVLARVTRVPWIV